MARNDPLLLRALRREPVERIPIWLMRQAGRYMPEYRALRERIGFLDLCKSPTLCADVMAQAVERLDVDAAIIFSDLLPILEPMGFELVFAPGDGPLIMNRFEAAADLGRVRELTDVSPLDFVFETVAETRRRISPEKAIIGFAGAPFTLAGYAIEGKSSRDFLQTRRLMRSEPDVWNELLARFSRSIARYLNAQAAAGAEVLQLFDSWAGVLSADEYRQYVLPHVQTLLAAVTPNVPIIYFWTGNPALLPIVARLNTACVGVDHRVDLSDALAILPKTTAIQGNLAPETLLSDTETIRSKAEQILKIASKRPGFIFNLGHGILKTTPVENAAELVRFVHQWQYG